MYNTQPDVGPYKHIPLLRHTINRKDKNKIKQNRGRNEMLTAYSPTSSFKTTINNIVIYIYFYVFDCIDSDNDKT